MTNFALAPDFELRALPLGPGGERLLLIEGVMQDWHELRAFAAASRFQPARAGTYPGLRAPLPGLYVRALLRRLDPAIRQIFFAGRKVALARFECSFSMVTASPAALAPVQRLPHVDVASPDRVGIVHYLCGPPFGGTAFYRQLATGFERIGPDERTAWAAARVSELAALGPENAFPGEGTPGYSQTMAMSARPDRLIAYRSYNLHSGVIDRPELLSADPLTGRLTAVFFLDYAAV